jgi:hypothetical protein
MRVQKHKLLEAQCQTCDWSAYDEVSRDRGREHAQRHNHYVIVHEKSVTLYDYRQEEEEER